MYDDVDEHFELKKRHTKELFLSIRDIFQVCFIMLHLYEAADKLLICKYFF